MRQLVELVSPTASACQSKTAGHFARYLCSRSRSATSAFGAIVRYASITIAASSSQSALLSLNVSRYTPSQSANTPDADVGGLKNRSGSDLTISSWTPAGAGHHNEIRPSLLWLSWK